MDENRVFKKDVYGLIDQNHFERILDNDISFEKLNSRANKSKKDSHDHEQLTAHMLSKIQDNKAFYDLIGSEYESSLSDSYRNKEGVYYTPQFIVNDLVPTGVKDVENKSFCDPSCGSGNFIIRALDVGFKPENIYGFDTDPVAIAITKKRILDKTGYASDKIINTNFLSYIADNSIKFDFVYTNPPWGKKLQKEEKEQYAYIFGAGKSKDTCSLFFFASLRCLNKGGSLGFLLPEAFFNIATFEDARFEAIKFSIKSLVDYGKPFKGLMTKAQAIVLSKELPKRSFVYCKFIDKDFTRTIDSFVQMPKKILNFSCNQETSNIIEHVYSKPHTTLRNNAKWGLGIVTGNNKKFQNNSIKSGLIPIFRGSDITYGGVKEPSLFIPKDLSIYQQVAPIDIYEAPKKLIYKFISSKLCFSYDKNQRYVLNSANMLILLGELSNMYQQLSDLFNSKFMNWVFTNIFNTHKVLRGDLESLPIHLEFFKNTKILNENEYLNFLNIEEIGNETYRIKK